MWRFAIFVLLSVLLLANPSQQLLHSYPNGRLDTLFGKTISDEVAFIIQTALEDLSTKCHNQMQRFANGIVNQELWALQSEYHLHHHNV